MKKLLTLACLLCMAASMNAQVVTFTYDSGENNDTWGSATPPSNLNTGTAWRVNPSANTYAIFKASEATYIQGYTMTLSYNGTDGIPYTWNLKGSNDKTNWDLIHSQVQANNIKEDYGSAIEGKSYTFYCNTSKQYLYYKISITAKDCGSYGCFRMYRFDLIPSSVGFSASGNGMDGNTGTKQEGNTFPQTITVNGTAATRISGFQFTTANDNAKYNGRNPKTLQVEGSNDNTNWTTLQTWQNSTVLEDKNYYPYVFRFNSPQDYQYQYYRFSFDDVDARYFQMSEIAVIVPSQISNAAQLADFASMVNAGAIGSDAILMDNINYSSYTGVANMIGDNNSYKKYAGTFDGQNHTVTVNFTNTSEATGLFRWINGATIQNLKVAGTITASNKFAGGIVGRVENGTGTIRNCESAVTINDSGTGDATHGGVLAAASGGVQVTNCLFSGAINASNREGCGGIVGWGDASVQVNNCLVTGTMNVKGSGTAHDIIARGNATGTSNRYVGTLGSNVNNRTSATSASTIQKTRGELCYLLNGSTNDGTTWTQTIGTNAYPIPFSTSQTVHQASTSCYTNLPVFGGTIQIGTPANLQKFASEVNAGNVAMDAVLTGDINMSGQAWPKPIGDWNTGSTNSAYGGHFDGQGNTISNLTYTTTQSWHGLFGVLTTGAIVENIAVNGTVTNSSHSPIGTIAFARDNNPIIRNVHSFLNFNNTHVGAKIGGILGQAFTGTPTTVTIDRCTYSGVLSSNDNEGNGNYGGIIGYTENNNNCKPVITNCLFDGILTNTATSPGNCTFGGIMGYIGGGPYVTISNCLSVGTVTSPKAGKICGAIKSANSTINNCYYNGGTANAIVESTPSITATSISDAQLASGEVCYLLNGSVNAGTNWYQDLSGTEAHPYPFGSKTVSAGQWFSNSNDVYYNLEGGNYTVYQLNMSDTQTEYAVPANVMAKNVSITRTIPKDQWIGLCLPFDYDIPSDWDVRELTSVVGSGESASMRFYAASSIVAGKPYIVKPSSAVTSIEATDKAIATAASTESDSGVNMIGNFAQTAIPVGSYYINTSSQLKKLTGSSVNMKGFRAYFTVANNVKALNFDFEDDDPTGINDLNDLKDSKDIIYNVAGQRLNKTQRGINIINGKKILK